jgi:hypothetical protein
VQLPDGPADFTWGNMRSVSRLVRQFITHHRFAKQNGRYMENSNTRPMSQIRIGGQRGQDAAAACDPVAKHREVRAVQRIASYHQRWRWQPKIGFWDCRRAAGKLDIEGGWGRRPGPAVRGGMTRRCGAVGAVGHR